MSLVHLGLLVVEAEQRLQHHQFLHRHYQFQQTNAEHQKDVLLYVILSVLNYNNWWMFCRLLIHGEYTRLYCINN